MTDTMTTDLALYRAYDLATVGEPASLVEQPTGPIDLPPDPDTKPTTSDKVNAAGSMTCLAGALGGLIWTANTQPELAGYPILAVMGATTLAAVVHLRSLSRAPR